MKKGKYKCFFSLTERTQSITFKCIKCKKTFEKSKIPLVVLRDEPFEAHRVCVECLEYCRSHGLNLQTLKEYEEKNCIEIEQPIKNAILRHEEQRGVKYDGIDLL